MGEIWKKVNPFKWQEVSLGVYSFFRNLFFGGHQERGAEGPLFKKSLAQLNFVK